MQIEVDYALGGGISGARVTGTGATCTRCHGAATICVLASAATDVSVRAAGAHGAMDWHPFGAQGNRQGSCSCSRCAGAVVEAVSLAGICMSAIDAAESNTPGAIWHAYPLSTSTSWRRTRVMKTEMGRRSRRTYE